MLVSLLKYFNAFRNMTTEFYSRRLLLQRFTVHFGVGAFRFAHSDFGIEFGLMTKVKTVTELVWAKDRLSLFNDLEIRNEHATFPLRNTLWMIACNSFEGHVYVDQWPNYRFVSCLHSTKLYAPESDRDFVTLAQSSEDPEANLADQDGLNLFLKLLSKERQWDERQGVIFFCVTDSVIEMAQSILRLDQDRTWLSKPLRHYTCCERKNLEKYELLRKSAMTNFAESNPTLVVGKLKPEEAEMVANQWPYQMPDKVAFFAWLIEIAPSVCIRDSKNDDRLLSWVVVYQIGAVGAAYVSPELRGRGLSDVQSYQLAMELTKFFPTSMSYFLILDDNIAALKNAKKICFDLKPSDLLLRILVCNSSKGDKKLKAKT